MKPPHKEKSAPQLRKELADALDALREANAEIERLMSLPPKEVIKTVDVPSVKVKVVEKDVPGKERIVYRDKVIIQYHDNPKHIAMIKKLRAKNAV